MWPLRCENGHNHHAHQHNIINNHHRVHVHNHQKDIGEERQRGREAGQYQERVHQADHNTCLVTTKRGHIHQIYP